MSIAFGSPSRYIQGPGELSRLAEHAGKYGNRIVAVIDSFFYEDMSECLKARCEEAGQLFSGLPFSGEITREKILEVRDCAAEWGAEVIVGIGGGKTLDTAKAVACQLSCPLILGPTSASTDAPTSAMSVIYNDKHEHDDVYYYKKNPDLVLVDSQIIADAPVRFLVAGMGDALATVYEARASIRTQSPNYIDQETGPYLASRTAIAIAELCGQVVLEYGAEAKKANENHVVNQSLEAVIEANTLMSGLGFENVGCAASHVICNGITACPGGDESLHGEKVAYGILCQLTAEKAPQEELDEIRDFYEAIGLPLQLQDLGIAPTEDNLRIISRDTRQTEWTREPFDVSDEDVRQIIETVEKQGGQFRKQHAK